MKKFLAGLSAVAVLAAGGVAFVGLSTGVASAQEGDATTEEAPADEQVERRGKHRHARFALRTAAETIGIDVADLVAAIEDGSTISDIAAANGSSGDAVVDALVAAASDRVDQAVADGRITAEEGAEKLTEMESRLDELVDEVLDLPQRGNRGARGLAAAAEVIGIEPAELIEGLRAGSSVADVAEANGSSGQAVIDAMVAHATERIDAAVESGRITADEAADKLAEITERITNRVNTVPDFDSDRFRERGVTGDPAGQDAVDA